MPAIVDDPLGIEQQSDPLGIEAKDDPLQLEPKDDPLAIESQSLGSNISASDKLGVFQPSQFSSGVQYQDPTLNPDYDFTRATGGGLSGLLAKGVNSGMDLAGKAAVGIANLPTTIANKVRGAKEGNPNYTEPLQADQPAIHLPELTDDDLKTLNLPPAVKGVHDALRETLEGLTEPQMALTLPALGLESIAKPVTTAFATQLAANLPSDVQNITTAQGQEEAAKAWADTAIHAMMLKGASEHSMTSESTPEASLTPNAAGQPTPEPAAPSASRFPLPAEAQSALDSVKTAPEPETPPQATPDAPSPHQIATQAAKAEIAKLPVDQIEAQMAVLKSQAADAMAKGDFGAAVTLAKQRTDYREVWKQKTGMTDYPPDRETPSATKENVPAPNESINPIMGNTQSAAGDEINKGSVTTPALSPEPPLSGASSKTEPLPNSEPVKEEVAPSQNKEQPQTFGIAQRVRDVRGDKTPSGEGVTAEDSVEHGRDLLSSGVDPEKAMSNFETNGRLNADDIAVTRAHGEALAKTAKDIETSKGVDSTEYQAADKALTDWDARTKKMQTEWHRQGMAQQGETDIDTGTFTGLQREFRKSSGKDFTPEQAETAQGIAKKVQKATGDVEEAKAKVFNAMTKDTPETATPKKPIAKKVTDTLEKTASDALARIKSRRSEGRLMAGLDPTDLADHAIYGAAKISKGVIDFGQWSNQMRKELGEYVKPHLKDIYAASKQWLADHQDTIGKDSLHNVEAGKKFTPEQVKSLWKRAKTMVDNGESNFDDVRYKLAQELGIPVKDVTEALTQPKGAKRMTDDMYQKMSDHRRIVTNAKDWLNNAKYPGFVRFARSIPRAFFAAKVFGHGTVGMITHAGINIFNPMAWKNYFPNFFRQYKLMFDKGYHEQMMQDLVRDPLYTKARRAGLANDPTKLTDEYQKGAIRSILGKGAAGKAFDTFASGRGFDALKLFRQAQFNQAWEKLPPSLQNPEMAKLIADGVNHATGAVQSQFPQWLSESAGTVFFAPKLEASRWQWLIGDSARSAMTLGNWNKATPEARNAAMADVKQKAAVVGTLGTLLAINQGILKAMGSKQNVNFTDTKKSDYLAFKVDGKNVGLTAPIIGVARLLHNLWVAADATKFGAKKPSEVSGDYLRSKLSPFGGFAYDLYKGKDFQGRPLPFSNKPAPHKEGLGKYSVLEYTARQIVPIPFQEAVTEVWKSQGMDESTIERFWKAIVLAVSAGSTGARVTPDYNETK